MEITYHIIVLVVVAVALVRGWATGAVRQAGSVIGMAVGALAAHAFYEPAFNFFFEMHLWPVDNIAASFAASLLGCSAVYGFAYIIMTAFGKILESAVSIFETGVIDSLFGCVICSLKYIIVLSIIFNFIIAANPSSPLMRYACYDDGNIIEGVMLIAPVLLGCESYEELAHKIQLKEAKKISYNYPASHGVISIEAQNNIRDGIVMLCPTFDTDYTNSDNKTIKIC